MIIPTEQEKSEIINCLKELDGCSRCILRFLGVKSANVDSSVYLDPEVYLNSICEDIKTKPLYLIRKKVRRNPCPICLNIFQDATIERFVENISLTDIKEYKYSDYVIYVSFPKSVIIRNHSVLVYLREKYPHIYQDSNGLENLNKIFRISSNTIVSKKINKHFCSTSDFIVHFEIGYEDDEVEIQNLKKLTHLRKGNQQVMGKNFMLDILEKLEDRLFKEQFSVPPKIPDKLPFTEVQFKAEPIWIGGRYLKFSRNMGQTPWIINNKSMAEHCLLDILYNSFEKILGYDKRKFTFSASGREDADVRMLGNGRPFYVQIDDPKDKSITFDQFRAIEEDVLKSKLAAVVKLQIVTRVELKKIKDGEEHKRKHYYALCHTDADNMDEVVNKINNYFVPLEICQKTPIRVLHRRTQAVRKKLIYSMNAKIVPGYSDLFEIEVVTQAGTYVKEFVNGDFERTTPNLCNIIQKAVDIVALDVTRIELNWPEESNIVPK